MKNNTVDIKNYKTIKKMQVIILELQETIPKINKCIDTLSSHSKYLNIADIITNLKQNRTQILHSIETTKKWMEENG